MCPVSAVFQSIVALLVVTLCYILKLFRTCTMISSETLHCTMRGCQRCCDLVGIQPRFLAVPLSEFEHTYLFQ
jgi:hypothetical protein